MERQKAQLIERRTLKEEVGGSKPALDTWLSGRIPLKQP